MRDSIFVLLYDTDYMTDVKSHPDYSIPEFYVQEGEKFNQQLKEIIPLHPALSDKQVNFYQKPETLIADLDHYQNDVRGVLNFCDDYADRVALFKLPSLFEMYGIPYSGYTTRNLVLLENKFYCYSLAKQLGINVPETFLCTKYNFHELNIKKFPVFVKPNEGGGSEGVEFENVVFSKDELFAFGNKMLAKYGEIVISEFLPGDEVTIGFMRDGDQIITLTPRLMHFKGFTDNQKVWTSTLKWDHHPKPGPRELIKTELDGNLAAKKKLITDSLTIFQMMECKDTARIDWKYDANGVLKFLDFNENPNITEESAFYWCLTHSGRSLKDVIFAVIDNLIRAIKTGKN
jgi:D-alanine-D-alanine ligase